MNYWYQDMTEVFVLFAEPRGYDDSGYVLGVFATENLSHDYMKIHHPFWVPFDRAEYGQESYSVEKYEVISE